MTLLAGDGTIVTLREIPLTSKLEALFRRNAHGAALRLAEAEGASPATMGYIHHQFADYLYNDKQDFDAAMQQYIQTIGHLEPSYVIRRYLDGQRIQQLALYLEALHDQEQAIPDHTTLLLNCYTKMKDVEKLNSFVGVGENHSYASNSGKRQRFDVETAVKVSTSSSIYTFHRSSRFCERPGTTVMPSKWHVLQMSRTGMWIFY